MSGTPFPASVGKLSPQILSTLIGASYPGVAVERFDVVDTLTYGQGQVSTADRLVLDLHYAPGAPSDLPRRIVVKTMIETPHAPAALYENEVGFYQNIRPSLKIEAPRCIGATFDGDTGQFGLLLEDLRQRSAQFPNVTQPVSVEQVRALLDTLAGLHAAFWDSPRFAVDLAWVQTHRHGKLYEFFETYTLKMAEAELRQHEFKRELLARLNRTAAQLCEDTWAVQQHQQLGPATLLHGDAHLGNSYLLPDGRGGLLDWQLMVRGCWAHDVNYLIVTTLSTELRRRHERELLAHYLDALARNGVHTPPSREDAWRDYRLGVVWSCLIGWLIVPQPNYSRAIVEGNLERIVTAILDFETLGLIDHLLHRV
jgi:aminoglycoside phosphotransferase (APT) family kinase protein